MVVSIYVLGVVLFAVSFAATGLSKSFAQVLTTVRLAVSVAVDPQLDDNAKELAARRAALNLLKQSILIAIKGSIAVASALLPFWAANALALRPWNETIAFALRWDVLGITTLVMFGIWFIWRRLAGGTP